MKGLNVGQHTAIPRSDDDTAGSSLNHKETDHLKAIAFTAGFHFVFIEQGGTSLYPSLAQRVSSRQVLRILLSIGPTETAHFQTWQDKAGNATPLTDTDPITHATVTFADLTTGQPESLQGQPDHARALSVSQPEISALFGYAANADKGGGDGRGYGAHSGRAVYRPKRQFLRLTEGSGEGCGRSEARKLVTCRDDFDSIKNPFF